MILKILKTPWPAILWSAFVFIVLIIPGDAFEKTGLFHVPGLDKIVHIILFGIMVFLWNRFYAPRLKEHGQFVRKFLLIVVLTILFGITMEFIQRYFIPLRNFETWDIMADAAGSITGGILSLKFWTKK